MFINKTIIKTVLITTLILSVLAILFVISGPLGICFGVGVASIFLLRVFIHYTRPQRSPYDNILKASKMEKINFIMDLMDDLDIDYAYQETGEITTRKIEQEVSVI